MDMDTTSFNVIFQKFYDRIEKDETFFKYHNVDVAEAITIAHQRAKNYLLEVLDELSSVGGLQVDFSDYDDEFEKINFRLYPKEVKLVVEMMYLTFMRRDEVLLHAMEINFSPSDLTIFSPANERTSYRNFIKQLSDDVELKIDNYKNRDRKTGCLRQTIDWSLGDEV